MTGLELACRAISGHGWHVVRAEQNWWVKADCPARLAKTIEGHGPRDLSVSIVPYLELGQYRVRGDSPCLWVRTETRDACRRLTRFKPEPSIIIREGSSVRSVALWWLQEPIPAEKLERANGRLSYCLRTKLKHGTSGFEFAPPGTVITEGRAKPLPVVTAGGSGERVSWGRVVGRLRDRPERPEWIKAA